MFEAGKMGKPMDLSNKNQIMRSRALGQSVSKTGSLIGCSQYAVVSAYQKKSKEGQLVNQQRSHDYPRLSDACG